MQGFIVLARDALTTPEGWTMIGVGMAVMIDKETKEAVPVTAVAEPVTQEAVYAVMFVPPLEDGSENAMLA